MTAILLEIFTNFVIEMKTPDEFFIPDNEVMLPDANQRDGSFGRSAFLVQLFVSLCDGNKWL